MVEAWRQLQRHRAGRQEALTSVETIRKKWGQPNGTPNGTTNRTNPDHEEVPRFKETYDDVVDALRKRYANAPADAWFAGNGEFLKDLDALFTKLKAHEAGVAEIQTRINQEKEKWYRLTIRTSPLGGLAEKTIGRSSLAATVGDTGRPFRDAAQAVRRALPAVEGQPPTAEDVLAALEGLDPAKDQQKQQQAIGERLADFFLRGPGAASEIAPPCAPAARALQSGEPIDKVIADLERQRASAAGRKSQAEKHRRKLAELRRAQAAHLQAKRLKAQKRERKQKVPQVEGETYESLPEGISLENVQACSLCQVFAGLGVGQGRKVYVSAEDCEANHEEHIRMEHSCAAGRECVQLTEEDEDMTGSEGAGVVICRECAEDLDRATTYCSERCAAADFRRHREDVHVPGRRKLSKREVEVDTGDLVFEDDEKTKYHVEDVNKYVWRLADALDQFFTSRNPDADILSVS